MNTRHIYYECMRCRAVRCMACESPAPDEYSGEIKTDIRWCGEDECVTHEATSKGVAVEIMRQIRTRVQAAWRPLATCAESR